jgi:hypothetical protein
MNKAEEFLTSQKEHFGKIYVDVSYAIDNISPFFESKDLKKRKYAVKLPVLRKYIDLIGAAELEIKKGGFLGFFSNDKCIELLKEYKNDNSEVLNQLEKCSRCSCLNCTADCHFDSCLGCRRGSKIESCDHTKLNVTVHDSFSLELTNDKTGHSDRYTVLGTLQDCVTEKKYIVIHNSISEEKFILYYYTGIDEDSYGEITDSSEFDFIASTMEGINL